MANSCWSYYLLFLFLGFSLQCVGSVKTMEPNEADGTDSRQQEPAESTLDESKTEQPDNSSSSNDSSLQNNSTDTNCQHLRSQGIYEKSGQQDDKSAQTDLQHLRSQGIYEKSGQQDDKSAQTDLQHLRSQGIYEKSGQQDDKSAQTDLQHLRSQGIYEKSGQQDDKSAQTDLQHLRSQGIYEKSEDSEQKITVQRKRSHGRFGRLKRSIDMETLKHEHHRTTQSKNKTSKARYTRKTFYSRKPRPVKETCCHGLEITNDHQDLKELRSAFERIKGATRKRLTYRKKTTTCKVIRNVTRTKKTRRKTEITRMPTVGLWNMETSTVDHIVKRRHVETKDDQINVEDDGKRKKRNLDTPVKADTNSIMGKLNKVIAENAGLLKHKRAIEARNDVNEADFLRIKRAIRPNIQNNALKENNVESDERFDVKYEPELLAKAETLLNRDKRFVSESKLQYVSRGARERAYRSYEDYVKKTKHECPEDKICRQFKEEMNREDSFDGRGGVWNE